MSKEKIDNLKIEITDLKQAIYSMKTAAENEAYFKAVKDVEFLEELHGHLQKWDESNDIAAKEYAFKMIEDWIDELNEQIKL